ncbi:Trp biosynthesis-associated membrane protein [Leucobacter denitrificans]|uniref:Trp biosynthesis-associated membrane protein n=1 Tax=Leucobacter denitrificans TaxID=683042 RepID=A0A7G9S616_9MICO|nr:Trp biosynthesis-associated membrane protein [Leucobacter denitrificans]QNN63291.1 Trp biosynthesis-associated membrane protein [Leucobacter denitrificans]
MSSKAILILLVVVGGGLGLLASVQVWIQVEFLTGVSAVERIEVTGQQASPAITLISLAALAAALVLTIAGPVFRKVIGLLVLVLGAGLAAVGTSIALSPIDGARSQIAESTGISGDSYDLLVASISSSAWPTITAVIGVLLGILGVCVLILSGRWKTAGRKYDSGTDGSKKKTRTSEPGDRISEWDALSDGDDPTDR